MKNNTPTTEYPYYFGTQYIGDSFSHLKNMRYNYVGKKRILQRRLRKIMNIKKRFRNTNYEEQKNYFHIMGYEYIFDTTEPELILAGIDSQFMNTQIHQIELELSFINMNLKVANKEINKIKGKMKRNGVEYK